MFADDSSTKSRDGVLQEVIQYFSFCVTGRILCEFCHCFIGNGTVIVFQVLLDIVSFDYGRCY